MNRGSWWATVHRVAKCQTLLSGFHFITSPYPTVRKIFYIYDSFDCCCSVAQSCPALCDPMNCSMPGFPALHFSLDVLKLMSIESVIPCKHLILSRLLLLLPSVFPSIRVFSNELVLHIRWPKSWSFSINPSSEYSGVNISFRIGWFDLFAVQRTLKSLLQHHS